MHILKKPDLSDPKMRAKLAKGMGHNYYGEPAWPNDLLYIFPVVILGTIACVVGLAVLDPAMLGDKADPAMKADVEAAIAELKTALEGEDDQQISEKSEALSAVLMKLGEAAYQGEQDMSDAQPQDEATTQDNDDVVDAEFEEVDDDKDAKKA